jgi:hypothetical protein
MELLAVGDDGLTSWYDGESWTTEYIGQGFYTLSDVWLSPDPQASMQAVAVGERGLIFTYDGSSWTRYDEDFHEDFNAVWGDGLGTVWAVGDRGLVQKWNGVAFEHVEIGPEAEDDTFNDVSGTSPIDVWLLGRYGVWIYDGASWTSQPLQEANLEALHVTATDVWVVGRGGVILHRTR